MIVPRLIEQKRDGHALSRTEWRELVHAYTHGTVPDYQMAALLMACYFQGLDRAETDALTEAMLSSGSRLEPHPPGIPRIDKHSTGGVGDKTSIALAPLIASLGVAVPMMSGRGLGHTGGTLDKLESIPGFRTNLSLAETRSQIERIGCALIGQTGEIAPADRKLYALRDATATVEAIPLIAASIMSKKIAEGLTGLVLDVKRGSGAFLPNLDSELELARTMIELGATHSCPVTALVTAMDRPLGAACGNALETREAIELLLGSAPQDFAEVTFALGAEMLTLAGTAQDRDDARHMMHQAIASGHAAEKLRTIIEAQGGDPRVVDDPSILPAAPVQMPYRASRTGFVTGIEPRAIGHAVIELGGGRRKMDDTIDSAVGFVFHAKPGATIHEGETIATIHARDSSTAARAAQTLDHAITIADAIDTPPLPLVSHRITAAGVETLH